MKSISCNQSVSAYWQTLITHLLLVIALCVGSTAWGQATTGISGVVQDSSGGAVPDAVLVVRNHATGTEQTVTASSSGVFSLSGLLPGDYDVRITHSGYETLQENAIRVDVGVVTHYAPVLRLGTESTTVTVSASSLQLEATAPTDSTTIDPQVVTDLPLSIGQSQVGNVARQIDSFVFLAAGTTGNNFSHRINGGVDFQNEVLFNGIPITYAESQGFQTGTNPPFESISEFKVLRSVFNTQYGLGQGALSYQFRSGTSAFHGVAYEYLRNDALDARPFSFGGNRPVNINKQHDYGFNIGGPVIIPHLYDGRDRFFWNFTSSWYRFNGAGDNAPRTYPLPSFRTGDFSALLAQLTPTIIYDPSTGLPFANNVIPADRISPLSQKIAALFPDPNLAGQLTDNSFAQIRSFPVKIYAFSYSLDYNITPRQTLHFTHWRTSKDQTALNGSASFIDNPLSSLETTYDKGTGFLLTYNNVLTPKLVFQAGVGVLGAQNGNVPISLSKFTVPGINADILPALNFSGGSVSFSSTGTGGLTANRNRKVGITATANATWVKGINNFAFGGEFREPKQNVRQCGQCAGVFNFSSNETAQPGSVSSGGNSFASFLLGLPDSISQQNALEAKLRSHEFSIYAQDDIKLSPRLNVNAGLRYDILVPFTELSNSIVFFDPTRANSLAGGLPGALTKYGSCDGCAGYNRADIKWSNVSPRIGFTYQPDRVSVLKAGYALLYLNGGAYEFGTSEVANTYTNVLGGSRSFGSTGSNTSSYGEWDKAFPAATQTPFTPGLNLGGNVAQLKKSAGAPPYQQDWTLSVQRELTSQTLATITYTANRSTHLAANLNTPDQGDPRYLALGDVLNDPYNSPRAIAAGVKEPFPGFGALYGAQATVSQALKPYPQYNSIGSNYDLNGSTSYNALQAEIQTRSKGGLNLLGSYVWSKLLDNFTGGSGFSIFNGSPANRFDQKAEWAISSQDFRHNFKASGTYELPIGRGKRFAPKSKVVDTLIGGWQVGAIVNYSSGTPVGIGLASGNALGGLGLSARPIRLQGVAALLSDPSKRAYARQPLLNAAAFTQPADYTLTTSKPRYGDIRNPYFADEDMNILKRFHITERVDFEFRAEYFNVLNRVTLGGLNGAVGSAGFGTVGGSGNSSRVGQVSGRLSF